MSSYPKVADERRRTREIHRRRLLARAEAEAKAYGKSLNCRVANHARIDPDHGRAGCLSDGSGCLCECHDPT